MNASPDKALNVAVLMGGPSLEAEVSRSSAGEVAAALQTAGHQTTLIELDSAVIQKLTELDPDVVFPALHGPPGEDGTVQGLLELMHLPYVGSGVRASALAMDKGVAKLAFKSVGLPVADDLQYRPPVADASIICGEIESRFGRQVAIKPLAAGSAVGVTLNPDGAELLPLITDALTLDGGFIVEPFVSGMEITVGVFDPPDQPAQAFPVIEIVTRDGEWYDYQNRYAVGGSRHIIPARLDDALNARIMNIAVQAHQVLGLRDLSRADLLVTGDGDVVLLEVNTMPGMTATSLYPDGARAWGLEFPQLLDQLVRFALARGSA